MSEPDLGNSFFLLILFYIASIFFIEHKKLKNSLLSDYKNKLNITAAECALYCKYLFGIDRLNENTVLCLCADNESIKITSGNTIIKTIYISDILIFEEYDLNSAMQKMMLAGAAVPIDSKPFSKFIALDYFSDNNEIKELFFSLDLDKHRIKANKFFLSKCNIYDFINKRLIIINHKTN